jgi:hypothetical protein
MAWKTPGQRDDYISREQALGSIPATGTRIALIDDGREIENFVIK